MAKFSLVQGAIHRLKGTQKGGLEAESPKAGGWEGGMFVHMHSAHTEVRAAYKSPSTGTRVESMRVSAWTSPLEVHARLARVGRNVCTQERLGVGVGVPFGCW